MTQLEERWAKWDVDDEVEALAAGGARQSRSKKARSFLDGRQLKAWLKVQNKKGLAPTTKVLSQALGANAAAAGRTAALGSHPDRRKRKAFKDWVRRWSAREGVTRGRFKVGPGLSLATAREKATSGVELFSGKRKSLSPFDGASVCALVLEGVLSFCTQKRHRFLA